MNRVLIGSDNGLVPVWHQAITWTNEDFLSLYHFDGSMQERLNSSALAMELCLSYINASIWNQWNESWIKFKKIVFEKMHLKTSLTKWQPFCSGLIVLNEQTAIEGATFMLSSYRDTCHSSQMRNIYVHLQTGSLLVYPMTLYKQII